MAVGKSSHKSRSHRAVFFLEFGPAFKSTRWTMTQRHWTEFITWESVAARGEMALDRPSPGSKVALSVPCIVQRCKKTPDCLFAEILDSIFCFVWFFAWFANHPASFCPQPFQSLWFGVKLRIDEAMSVRLRIIRRKNPLVMNALDA